MKTIKQCRSCNNKDIIGFFDMGCQPPANALVKNKNIKSNSYPLSLSWCSNCNLVQLNETLPPEELFSNYVWVTGTSPITIKYSKNFYNHVINKTHSKQKGYVLEIASNDGTFLQPFKNNGYKVLGIDPASNITKIANLNGIPTVNAFFNVETARTILNQYGKTSIIIARNVIPHTSDIHGMIKGINICLDDDGLLIIECHDAYVINEYLHYDSIYHEHLHYFTLHSIEYLLNNYGLYINDIKNSPISGGSMVLFINKYKKEKPIVQEQREKEIHLNTLYSWNYFAIRTYEHRNYLLKTLPDEPIYCYGASARGLTMLNYCKLTNEHILAIADRNPIKQNMFTPVSGIPIVTPEQLMDDSPSCILITAWNFADEIINDLKTNYGYNGGFIVPLPIVKLIN